MPIGAGLRTNPIPPQQVKARSYRITGSSVGFLLSATVLLFLALGVEFEPWKNEWQVLNAWFGVTPSKPVYGTWNVTKAVFLGADGVPSPTPDNLNGTFAFEPDHAARLSLQRDDATLLAKGTFKLQGGDVVLQDLESSGRSAIPPRIVLRITWTGEDTLLAEVPDSEIMYLSRSLKR